MAATRFRVRSHWKKQLHARDAVVQMRVRNMHNMRNVRSVRNLRHRKIARFCLSSWQGVPGAELA